MNIEITEATPKHIPDIIRIAEKQLGASYIDLGILSRPGSVFIVGISAERVIGFCSALELTMVEACSRIPQLEHQLQKDLTAFERVGYIASIASDPAQVGRGVASRLLSACVDRLEAAGMPAVIMTGWKSSSGVHIHSMAYRAGFEEFMEIDRFWYDDSLAKGYSCPECGNPPCNCSAVVYYK